MRYSAAPVECSDQDRAGAPSSPPRRPRRRRRGHQECTRPPLARRLDGHDAGRLNLDAAEQTRHDLVLTTRHDLCSGEAQLGRLDLGSDDDLDDLRVAALDARRDSFKSRRARALARHDDGRAARRRRSQQRLGPEVVELDGPGPAAVAPRGVVVPGHAHAG